jgi:hypothetical protein
MSKEIKPHMERLDEPLINRQIVLLFLEKFEQMTAEERQTISETIQIINRPVLLVK